MTDKSTLYIKHISFFRLVLFYYILFLFKSVKNELILDAEDSSSSEILRCGIKLRFKSILRYIEPDFILIYIMCLTETFNLLFKILN